MIRTPLGELMTLPARVRVLFLLVDAEVVYLVSWHLRHLTLLLRHRQNVSWWGTVWLICPIVSLPATCLTLLSTCVYVDYHPLKLLYLLLCPAVSDCTFFYVVLWYFERLCTRYVYLYFYFTFYLKKTFFALFFFFYLSYYVLRIQFHDK